jgi:hypothetical protein
MSWDGGCAHDHWHALQRLLWHPVLVLVLAEALLLALALGQGWRWRGWRG